jgi:hypothetical protein
MGGKMYHTNTNNKDAGVTVLRHAMLILIERAMLISDKIDFRAVLQTIRKMATLS